MDDVLRTPRLDLVPWRDPSAHRDAFAALCADADVMRHVGAGVPLAAAEAADVLDANAGHWARHGFGMRAAVLRATGELAGVAGIMRASEPGVRPGDVEIGWRIHPRHQGAGLATEAGFAIRDDAFARLRLARLVGFVRPANAASIAVATRVGMRRLRDGRCRRGLPLLILALPHPDAR